MPLSRSARSIRLLLIGLFTILVAAFPIGNTAQILSTPDRGSEVEQRIRHLQKALLPLVSIEGKAPETAKLADRMSELHVPGVSVAVIRNGSIDWARGFGVTKVGGAPVTPRTLFQAASISKPVAAMAVLSLVESGELDLDVDANRYLKSWQIPANEFTGQSAVTLRRLLSHTAGMTVHGFAGYASGAPTPSLLQVLNGENPANSPPIVVDTIPGKIRRYSGGGYVVIQQLLEDATGQSFPKLMKEIVLGPIGMTDSTYEQPLPSVLLQEAAMPHGPSGAAINGGPHTYPEMAAAGLWTTPTDLALFAIDLQSSLSNKPKHLLSSEMAREMLAGDEYGLGIGIGGSKQRPFFSHGGSNVGFRCNLIAYNAGDGIVVMTNSDTGGPLATEILYTIAHEYGWPDFKPTERTLIALTQKELERFVGAYQMAPQRNILITAEGNQLTVQAPGQGKVPLFAESETKFFLKVIDAEIEFLVDDTGVVSHLVLHQNGESRKLPRVGK
jgi:CubicO group peptidase (beta-lactamase class C family)